MKIHLLKIFISLFHLLKIFISFFTFIFALRVPKLMLAYFIIIDNEKKLT